MYTSLLIITPRQLKEQRAQRDYLATPLEIKSFSPGEPNFYQRFNLITDDVDNGAANTRL